MDKQMRLGIVGAGNMALAIAGGLVRNGAALPEQIAVSDVDTAKLESFAALGIRTTVDNQAVVDASDVVIAAVKPQIYEAALAPLVRTEGKVFVSIAPGLSVAYVKRLLRLEQAKVVRVMPNTPLLVGCGTCALCCGDGVDREEFAAVRSLFDALGATVVIPEEQMDEVVAVNGSSPAYVFMLIDAMMRTAEAYGFSTEDARLLSANTVMGAAKMVLERSESPEILKQNVCSKGGTTIEAVHTMEQAGFYDMMSAAMDACTKRAKELAK